MLDTLDHSIISLLDTDARMPNKEIARRLGVTESTAASRIRTLHANNVIRIVARRKALVGNAHTVLGLLNLYMKDPSRIGDAADAVAAMPGVITVYETTRRPELVAYVRAQDMNRFGNLIAGIQSIVPNLAQLDTLPIIDMRRAHRSIGNLQLPAPRKPPSDDLDERIIQALEIDGRLAIKALARQLGLSDTAVRYRMNKLTQDSRFEIVTVCDAKAMGYNIWTDIRMRVVPNELDRMRDIFIKNDNVINNAHISGEHNLHLVLISRSVEDVDLFINRHIRSNISIFDFTIMRIPKVIRYNYNIIF